MWRLQHPDGRVRFLKVGPSDHWPTPLDECVRMRWAQPHLPVPAVLDCGRDGDRDWMLTEPLPGTDATKHRLLAEPAVIVPILARGLRAFHDAAPAADCPFDFRVATALAHAEARVAAGLVIKEELHSQHAHLGPVGALAELVQTAPASEDLVVCHGDYCFPNVLLDYEGTITGFLDLGELGVADRWWDLAVGAWSVTWNVGPGWEDLFYRSYGVEPDRQRIAFFRLLYDLAS